MLKPPCLDIHLDTCYFFKKFETIRLSRDNPVTLATIRAWQLMRFREGQNWPLFSALIWSIRQQGANGINTLKDLLAGDTLPSNKWLRNMVWPDFFCYLQIRHYILHSTTVIDKPEISSLEKLLFQTVGRISICLFYEDLRAAPPVILKGIWD